MASKKPRKAQSSLEYLITYGWALIMIATIIGVLVFATGGGINTNTCTSFLMMICKGIGADGDTLIMVMQNATGQKITINPFIDIMFDSHQGYAEILYQDRVYRFDDVTISAGDEFTIQGKGMVLADTLTITYYEHTTGLTKTLTSNLSTDAPDHIELSNDGIDNDGDGLVDCQEPTLTDCEYVVDSAIVAPMTVTNVLQSIDFGQLIGTSGTAIAGNWDTDNSVTVEFYVESFTAGTTAYLEFFLPINNTTINLKQGWNVAEIPLAAPQQAVLLGSIMDPQIRSNGANFTISDSPKPKILLTLNP